MYEPEKKQFILKNSFGVSYHVFYEPSRGLCLRMLSDSYIWSRGFVLASHAVNDFAAALDNDDFLHFVFPVKRRKYHVRAWKAWSDGNPAYSQQQGHEPLAKVCILAYFR